MRKATALIILLAAEGLAQVSSNISLSNGVQLTIACTGGLNRLNVELEPATGNSFYRIFQDDNNLAVFAYELLVERTPDGDHFRVTAKPAGEDFAARFPNADAGKPTPTLAEPRESPLLASGDRFSVDLPVIPGVAENLSDVIQIRLNQRGVSSPDQAAQASATLRFVGLKVYVNSELVSPDGPGAMVA